MLLIFWSNVYWLVRNFSQDIDNISGAEKLEAAVRLIHLEYRFAVAALNNICEKDEAQGGFGL